MELAHRPSKSSTPAAQPVRIGKRHDPREDDAWLQRRSPAAPRPGILEPAQRDRPPDPAERGSGDR